MNCTGVSTSVLKFLSPVVGAVFALHAEVDISADTTIVQWLNWTNIITHAEENLRWQVLAQESQRVHLRR